MPLKLSVGISRKTGAPNFGSRGASVGLEIEANARLVRDPERLQQHLGYLFKLAEHSLDQQLVSNGASANGCSDSRDRPATRRQQRAISAIASRLELDLASQLNDRYGVDRPEALSVAQASDLIDALNSFRGSELLDTTA